MPSAPRTARTRKARPHTSSDWRPRSRRRGPRRVAVEEREADDRLFLLSGLFQLRRFRRPLNSRVRRPPFEREAGRLLERRRVAVTTMATTVTAATPITATTGLESGLESVHGFSGSHRRAAAPPT